MNQIRFIEELLFLRLKDRWVYNSTMNHFAEIRKHLDQAEREARASYDRGWTDAMTHIVEMASAKEKHIALTRPVPSEKPYARGQVKRFVEKFVLSHRDGVPTKDVIAAVRQQFPGGDPKAIERTTRTSLRRLKVKDEKITQFQGLWLAKI